MVVFLPLNSKMLKKKIEIVEEVTVKEPEVFEVDKLETVKVKPSKIEFNFSNGDLNVLRDKLNEVIDSM